MARRKGAVRVGSGVMCNICGKNCGKGAALKNHIEGAHDVNYDQYKKCYYGGITKVIADAWDDRTATSDGKIVMIHVLVRRFIGDPGPRGATRSANPAK